MKKFSFTIGKKFVSKIKNGPSRIKGRIDKTKQTFKDQLHEARQKPMSKRKAALLGFSTTLAIFGITILATVLTALAKDVSAPKPKPTDLTPAPAPIVNQKLREGLGGFAAAVCGGAAASGSYLLGAVCGLVVVIGVLARGK